ncbi:EAL domain-containing protein [Candidatus Accumulibacter sp. ACC003]|uniref:putative bifunctional diguanylate cyclase/phosphodiesterase n=1 Tax=Candidatus Accumulibacter sp. ACC003 TaxID=2823334 RepID=UPI0025BA130B|nr:EAL domain-containing protein [Candidatus Accumulibacter sp. ACC003]
MPATPPDIDLTTGFLNRSGGVHAAARAVADAEAKGAALAVLWLDIDRFRQINESFGHVGGDHIIAQLATRLRLALRSDSVLVRMGSDEFVALIPSLQLPMATRIGVMLLAEIERPLAIDNLLMRPSASMGLAVLEAGEDALSLLERADRAMIEAKRRGGNQLIISGDERLTGRLGVQLAREELAIEADLHSALESGCLTLEYQPLVGIDGRIEAVEALMRCDLPGRRLLPGKFIPVAEKTGMIVRLGEWSLLQGAQFAARLRDEGVPTKVAINVSRAQLTSRNFAPALQAALICANVAPALIELEFTESLFLDLSDIVQANLRSTWLAEVGIAIDDFGYGYSSLSNLKDLPASKLKLDSSFIKVLPEDRRAYAVVKAMAMLGRELGMTVIAEGVETAAQQAAVEGAAVDAVQGFFHARPMPEEAMLAWLKERTTHAP